MINIGDLLDTCGISYTDKQLAKLDKLVNELLKKLCLQQFDSNETTQHYFNPDSEDKLRNEGFDEETKLEPFQTAIHEFDFELEPHHNNAIQKEILENTGSVMANCFF